MGQRIREFDWSATPLGPVETWPQSLNTCIRIMLTSRQPIWIGWGKELIKFYNDPYKAIVGGKHPWALGSPASLVWKDIWRDIAPLLEKVMEKNEGTYVEAQLLIMERNGYPEETYYTFSYTPIPGEDGRPAGMICANTDDTDRIISERQLRTLTQLGKRLNDAKTDADIVHKTVATLRENPQDFPFALFYLIEGNVARLADSTSPENNGHRVPRQINPDDGSPLARLMNEAAVTRGPQMLDNVTQEFGNMPKGVWEVAADKAIILPVMPAAAQEPYGFLVVGLNPYRLLDEKYSGFFSLVADQVATSFANVHVLEEERKRAGALAEIDRAKTTFFSNISHEFRTPLTLLLGPIEELMQDPATDPGSRARLDLAWRNGLRMQKLVNALLDFSRIEAGRVEGRFARVDIGALTEDLASTFRSAVEKAGMELQIRCGEINEDVYVDVDMWEKIILNLVSNAFKYSREGAIVVTVEQSGDQVLVTVSDTGIGIPEDQQDKIFNRFHRIEHSEGRSQEGTGIGLAMVKELVKLHHGAITVKSRPGKGSAFIISIPLGKDHLPPEKITEAYIGNPVTGNVVPFVEEVAKWVPDDEAHEQQPRGGLRHTVLLADDNADMRDYITRLLGSEYVVRTVTNGIDAWEAARDITPDLIISDVMMPRLDGFGLVKKLRADNLTRNIPVIFLSARAGEEAKVEGLQAGADDYLVKPFSARELLARVDANIRIAQNRMASERKYRQLIYSLPAAVYTCRADGHIDLFNDAAIQLWGRYPEIGKDRYCGSHTMFTPQGDTLMPEQCPMALALQDGRIVSFEIIIGRPDGTRRHVIPHPRPIFDGAGNITGAVNILIDITDQVNARKKVEESEHALRLLADSLELTVRKRTEQLQRSNEDLLQFAHVVSHDLKEPVRKIKTFGKRLQDEYSGNIAEKGQTYLNKVLASTDRMITVIEGVLSYSALGASEEPMEKIDLNEVFRNIEADLEVMIQQKEASLIYNNLPVIEGAPVLIHQLFYNIVQNSLKFSRAEQPPVITITAAVVTRPPGNEWIEMRISDNGIGFEEEHAKNIFDPFARLHPKEKFEGTGLGLALCKKIVERHRGSISATGSRNKGAEFRIALPLLADMQ